MLGSQHISIKTLGPQICILFHVPHVRVVNHWFICKKHKKMMISKAQRDMKIIKRKGQKISNQGFWILLWMQRTEERLTPMLTNKTDKFQVHDSLESIRWLRSQGNKLAQNLRRTRHLKKETRYGHFFTRGRCAWTHASNINNGTLVGGWESMDAHHLEAQGRPEADAETVKQALQQPSPNPKLRMSLEEAGVCGELSRSALTTDLKSSQLPTRPINSPH